MHKWEYREKKLTRKKSKLFPGFNADNTKGKDKHKRKAIKQARRDKEAIWDNLETEGDE